MWLKKKSFDDSPLETSHKNTHGSQESQVERSIIWVIIVLLLFFHQLENENLFAFNSPTSAIGKPSFGDYKHSSLYIFK